MINRIVVKLPYPTRVGFFVKRKVGFSFDNLSAFYLREEIECNSGEQLKAWIKTNGESRLYMETLFAAAKSYCTHNVKRFKLDKRKMTQGIALLDENVSKQILKAWTNSETFGVKQSKAVENDKKKAI